MSELGTSVSVGPAVGAEEPLPPGEQLIRAFNLMRDELVSTLLYMLGNAEDAQDAAQDAFLKCWRNQADLPNVQNLRAWVFRVAMNTAKDMQRSAWHRKARPLTEEATMMIAGQNDAPFLSLEEKESMGQLRQAIMGLRSDEKEVFLLRQNGELTYEQIADMRNIPVGTVKTQMRSALQKLRKVLA
jgi:RNA polymerase sigma-70 factor (ECF subfamily)